MMTIMLLAPVFPFRFPLLNLCVRDGNNVLCQPLEALERRFSFRWFGCSHTANLIIHTLERNMYKKPTSNSNDD